MVSQIYLRRLGPFLSQQPGGIKEEKQQQEDQTCEERRRVERFESLEAHR
jgi:hypothetical protein